MTNVTKNKGKPKKEERHIIKAPPKRMVEKDVACVKATLEAIDADTIIVKGYLECDEDVSITCNSGSTIIIDELKCKDAKINVTYSSTVRIKHIELTGTCTINVDHSSKLKIEAGTVHTIKGDVTYSSTGICKAEIEEDNVKHAHASRWSV